MLLHVTTRLKLNAAGALATQVLSGTYMPDPFSLRAASGGRFEHAFARSSDQTVCLAVWQAASPKAIQEQWVQSAASDMKPLVTRITALPLADAQNAIQNYAKKINRQLMLDSDPGDPAVISFSCLCIRHNQALVMSAGTTAAYLSAGGRTEELTSGTAAGKSLGLHGQSEETPCHVLGPVAIEPETRLALASHGIQAGSANEAVAILASGSHDNHVADMLLGILASQTAGSALTLVTCLAESAQTDQRPSRRPARPSVPQARQEHQRSVFAKPPAPKIKHEPFSLKRLILWQVIPAWLQFWSLIIILALIILLVWLFFR